MFMWSFWVPKAPSLQAARGVVTESKADEGDEVVQKVELPKLGAQRPHKHRGPTKAEFLESPLVLGLRSSI